MEALQPAEERREAKGKGERERYTQLNTELQGIAMRDKAFLNEQSKKRGKQQNGKDERSFKKTGDIEGTFHARMGMIKERNSKDLTEAEEIKKWQEHTEELYKKGFNDLNNHDGVVTHLELAILDWEVK